MKKIVILLIAVMLAACSTPAAPTQQPVTAPVEPSATPVVVVQTVIVEATQAPTEVPPPTQVPPTAAPVVVTVVVQATQPPAVVADTPVSNNGTIPLDNSLGKGVFTNMTMSSNAFTLRCLPRDITFNITTTNQDIVDAVFYYRVVDNKRLYPSEWKAFGKMVANGNGNFTLTFKGEDIASNLRLDNSWFDFQFVGLAKSGDVVERTEKIQELVKYTFDCP